MKKVLVTGANGQLAKCIRAASSNFPNLNFTYATKDDLDIENEDNLRSFFEQNQFEICINTAAYTDVERAEQESDRAFSINALAAGKLATYCERNNVVLFHISTDYVFSGDKRTPYVETDATGPINVYGTSKLAGEVQIAKHCKRYYIFRTSWLYSEFGHNFYNTIQKYAADGKSLTITTEQTGAPTNANDLANALLSVTSKSDEAYGIYHFSNAGEASWYDFAEAILEESGQLEGTNLAKTDHYRTFAARPKYSVLNTEKFIKQFKLDVLHWRLSLKTIKPNEKL
jgi:dTDP-4-dehydrorhamnose reductase